MNCLRFKNISIKIIFRFIFGNNCNSLKERVTHPTYIILMIPINQTESMITTGCFHSCVFEKNNKLLQKLFKIDNLSNWTFLVLFPCVKMNRFMSIFYSSLFENKRSAIDRMSSIFLVI